MDKGFYGEFKDQANLDSVYKNSVKKQASRLPLET